MVCDWWECSFRPTCMEHCLFNGAKYPPCASCVKFDCCDYCNHYTECAKLISRYLPNMFRRLVREIRNGEDTAQTEKYIRRKTCGGRKNPTKRPPNKSKKS